MEWQWDGEGGDGSPGPVTEEKEFNSGIGGFTKRRHCERGDDKYESVVDPDWKYFIKSIIGKR